MINKEKHEEIFDQYLAEAVKSLSERGYKDIKADGPDYEQPAKLSAAGEGNSYVPDITAKWSGRKVYVEIARKTEDEQKLVTKWKLLETLAKMKDGIFKVMVPKGQWAYTKDLVSRYNLSPELEKMW